MEKSVLPAVFDSPNSLIFIKAEVQNLKPSTQVFQDGWDFFQGQKGKSLGLLKTLII